MNILKALLGEHGVFYAQFDYLERYLPTAQSQETVHSLCAMLSAALVPHAQAENELLFSKIEAAMGAVGPVVVMRMEHEQIEELLERTQKTSEVEAAVDSLLEAIAIAREHFLKEEQVLFPLASQQLPEQLLIASGVELMSRRNVVLA